ncbi:MAG: ribonuclease H-like domain-containing protein [Lachnospira sp.]
MLTFSDKLEIIDNYESVISNLKCISTDLSQIIMFDIETTGLSSFNNMCYLIGAVYFTDNEPHYIQWFATVPADEEDILNAFSQFIEKYNYIIHFNGDHFDIPFLLARALKHNVSLDFSHLKSLDLYKTVRELKSILDLDNYKQKTVEHFLQVNREDKYSGGELIEVYKHYLAFKEENDLEMLLLHNHDDCIGMVLLVQIISYSILYNGDFDIENVHLTDGCRELVISIALKGRIPIPLSVKKEYFCFEADGQHAKLIVPIIKNELKFFRSDYKDYYYIPAEDTAIHKSVSCYVDSKAKVKADKKNCYTRKTGFFIIYPENSSINTTPAPPVFRESYDSKDFFIEYSDIFLSDYNYAYSYALSILKSM